MSASEPGKETMTSGDKVVSLDTFAERNQLNALDDAEVSKLRRLVSRRNKRFVMEILGAGFTMLLCWFVGYLRLSIAWVLIIGLAAVFGLYRRVGQLIDDAAYLTYRWYTKRRALRTAESAEWLNTLIKEWMVFSESEFSAMLKRKLDSKFEKMAKKTKILDSMSLKSLTFGKQPPYFVGMRTIVEGRGKPTSVHVADSTSSGERNADGSLLLVIETDLEIRSDDFQLHIDARIKSIRKPVGIVVESLTLSGRLQLLVTLAREVGFPHIARVQASFTERPTVLFNLMLRGMNVMDVPLLRTAVHTMLVDAIAKTMVDPGRLGLLNRFRKLQREHATSPDACSPAGTAAVSPSQRVSALGVLNVTIRLLDSTSSGQSSAVSLRDVCTCILKLGDQKAQLRFCAADEEEEVISTDDDTEKRAIAKGESAYDLVPARQARESGGLCASMLLRKVDVDRLRVRLKQAKAAGHKSGSVPQFISLANWDVRLGDYLNALDVQAASYFELSKETKHMGTVRVAVELNYSPLVALNESLMLATCTQAEGVSADKEQHMHKVEQALDIAAVQAAVQRGVTAGALLLVLHSAADLLALDRNGTSDPYCVVTLNGRRVRTTPFHARTCAPQFDFAFELLVEDVRRAEIRLELFDYDGEGSSQKSKAKRSQAQDDRLGVVHLELGNEFVALRRVIPLVLALDSDPLDESVSPRRTLPPNKLSNLSMANAGPRLGTLTISYAFRPAECATTFFAQPSVDVDDDNASIINARHAVARTAEPASSHKRHQHRNRPRHDQMNVNDMLKRGHGLMEVRIIEARQLIAKDLNGRSDPFCVLRIGEETVFKTKTRHATLTPFWNETVTSRLPLDNETLELTVYDKDTFGRDFLGTCALSREAIHAATKQPLGSEPAKVWYPLTGVRRGEIHLAFRIIFDPRSNGSKNTDNADANLIAALGEDTYFDAADDRVSISMSMAESPPRSSRRNNGAYDSHSDLLHVESFDTSASFNSSASIDIPRPARPPPRNKKDSVSAPPPASVEPTPDLSPGDSPEDGVPPPVPVRFNSRNSTSVAAVPAANNGRGSDGGADTIEPSASNRTPTVTVRTELQLRKGELRKVSVSDDPSSSTDAQQPSNFAKALQVNTPRPVAGPGYSRLQGTMSHLRGLTYRHFLSTKERDRALAVRGSGGADLEKLISSLQSAFLSIKVKIDNRTEDSNALNRAPLESITIARSQPIRFAQVCDDVAHPFAVSTEAREVPLSIEFDVSSATAKPSIFYTSASLTITLKRKKQQPVASKSFQLSWLFAASNEIEPTWLKLDDEITVLLSVKGNRAGLADSTSPTGFNRHRSVKQSFKDLFSTKEHRE